VRWSYAGRGKRGGVRVISFNRFTHGEIWLLLIYGKSASENIPSHVLRWRYFAQQRLDDPARKRRAGTHIFQTGSILFHS
jgi:hypothetical protein